MKAVIIDSGHDQFHTLPGQYYTHPEREWAQNDVLFCEGDVNRLLTQEMLSLCLHWIMPNDLRVVDLKWEMTGGRYWEQVGVNDRARFVNEWCDKFGAGNVLLVSNHMDAVEDYTGVDLGLGIWIDKNASDSTRRFASIYLNQADSMGIPVRKYGMYVGDYAVTRDTRCPAVIVEHGFYTHPDSYDEVISRFRDYADCAVHSINRYFAEL